MTPSPPPPSIYTPRRQDFFPASTSKPASSSSSTLTNMAEAAGRWVRSLRKTAFHPPHGLRRHRHYHHHHRGVGGGAVPNLLRLASPRRLASLPNILVLAWALLLLWGERWVFDARVRACAWDRWETWPADATPHRLVLVADPQLVDPHTYPGRAWPLSALTYTVTDNFLRRSYGALERRLHPDSVFFLGDLFDGGREWRTAGAKDEEWDDPPWGRKRPRDEERMLGAWRSRYGNEFWMKEYARFVDIFVTGWNGVGVDMGRRDGEREAPGRWQRGRKLVMGLPGNHDVGFGAQVRLSARDRFASYFGEPNRVDVVGNHTVVSVDTPSLSARHADPAVAGRREIRAIHEPVEEFLRSVPELKRRAVEQELRFWHGSDVLSSSGSSKYPHAVYSTSTALPPPPPDAPAHADFPTILLTHVPLHRAPGTPCGPDREHWPPSSSSSSSSSVRPDHRNAISVSGGYQYQNVLEEDDSQLLVRSVGNVVHVFSGDDHDYCELVHDGGGDKAGIREITVKSISMAMGVPTPGFVMVSLWNPVGADGKTLGGVTTTSQKTTTMGKMPPTLQTHLCLLPNQFSTYTRYVAFAVVTIAILALRAVVVSALNLPRFSSGGGDLEDGERHGAASKLPLPLYATDEKRDSYTLSTTKSHSHSHSASYSGRHAGVAGSASRTRSGSLLATNAPAALPPPPLPRSHAPGRMKQLRINIDDDFFKPRKSFWRGGGGGGVRGMVRETGMTVWRVVWMAVGFWGYLTWKG